MKEKYSVAARQVLQEADRIAKQMNSGFVGTQHLLFGLIAVHKGVAEKVLRKNGVTPDRFASMLEDLNKDVLSFLLRAFVPLRDENEARPAQAPRRRTDMSHMHANLMCSAGF